MTRAELLAAHMRPRAGLTRSSLGGNFYYKNYPQQYPVYVMGVGSLWDDAKNAIKDKLTDAFKDKASDAITDQIAKYAGGAGSTQPAPYSPPPQQKAPASSGPMSIMDDKNFPLYAGAAVLLLVLLMNKN